MAKPKSSKGSKPTSNGRTQETRSMELIPESQLASPGAEFKEVFGERVRGWWALVPGNVVQGVLRDTFETKSQFDRGDGKKRKVYKIEVTDPGAGKLGCLIHPSDESEATDDGEPIQAAKGDVIGVDEKGFLKALGRVVVGQTIWVGYLGKEGSSESYPQGRHVFKGPLAIPAKVDPVTGEVTS